MYEFPRGNVRLIRPTACRWMRLAPDCDSSVCALHFGRVHRTIRVTPALEAGISDHVWSIEKIVGLLER